MTSRNDIERRLAKLEDDATMLRRKWPTTGDFESAFPQGRNNVAKTVTAADIAQASNQVNATRENGGNASDHLAGRSTNE